MPSAEDLRLRSLRPPKPTIDPRRAIGHLLEPERSRDGRLVRSLSLFLAGAECPFTCVFCDLWQHTLDHPTPVGAIPEQIRGVLEELDEAVGEIDTLKLYNASNYFDARAVPPEDDGAVVRLVTPFPRVVVECHPRLVGRRCFDFAEALDGRLEVAMGFETAHPEALARMNKKIGLDHLRRASRALADADIDLRAFVLLGAPFVPPGEELCWLERTVRFALEQGASPICLIPVRGDAAELRRLADEGLFREPDLDRIEAAFHHCRTLAPEVVRLDTWDLERFTADPERDRPRLETLRRLQLATPAMEARSGR